MPSIACQTLTVRKPAHIVATEMIMNKTDCDDPCTDATVTITWKNTGGRTGTFTPGISVNGIPTLITPVELGPGETFTQIFALPSMTEGDYEICPSPN